MRDSYDDLADLFTAANQAATTTTIGLATTYTGICVNNPVGSGVLGILRQVGVGLAAAPAAISVIGLLAGYSVAGVTTHTTPLIISRGRLDLPATGGVLKADAACTLVGTPFISHVLMGGFTAAATPSTSPALIDFKGAITIPPGGYVAIYTQTVASIIGSISWQEHPL